MSTYTTSGQRGGWSARAGGRKRVRRTTTPGRATDTAGCNKLKELATPGWRISLRTYSRQYELTGEFDG
ncbi:hypothetical protein HSR122_0122 [Halapricum desulfuricans]|uniref:Uncharacterized protein n=1 Tax=Halapricum desulfuricans TaxID=2841257 RepID=A0A897MZN1_9EURY|nr:hypothetical protein HSR122_0122 [Halapricum desulfuricans]